jgi:hypothetical protein
MTFIANEVNLPSHPAGILFAPLELARVCASREILTIIVEVGIFFHSRKSHEITELFTPRESIKRANFEANCSSIFHARDAFDERGSSL